MSAAPRTFATCSVAWEADTADNENDLFKIQWTHLQVISFAIAPVRLLTVVLLEKPFGGAVANEPTERLTPSKTCVEGYTASSQQPYRTAAAVERRVV